MALRGVRGACAAMMNDAPAGAPAKMTSRCRRSESVAAAWPASAVRLKPVAAGDDRASRELVVTATATRHRAIARLYRVIGGGS